jgi:hypothetical protein
MDAREIQELLQKNHPFPGHGITFQVMAVPGVSSPHQHSVNPSLKSLDDVMGGYGRGTHNPDDPKVGGILNPAHSGQVRGCVSAPVAEKG